MDQSSQKLYKIKHGNKNMLRSNGLNFVEVKFNCNKSFPESSQNDAFSPPIFR